MSRLIFRFSMPALLLQLAACEAPKSEATDPTLDSGASEPAADPLLDAVETPSDPMVIADQTELYAALTNTIPIAWFGFAEEQILGAGEYLSERGCGEFVEDGETTSVVADCTDSDPTLTGAIEVTRTEVEYMSTWEDISLVWDDMGLSVSGDGDLDIFEGEDTFTLSVDRAWVSHEGADDDEFSGTFYLRSDGGWGAEGLIYSGCLTVAGSPGVPDGELCFAVESYPDADFPEVERSRKFVQADRLWLMTTGPDASGEKCSTISVDGEELSSGC